MVWKVERTDARADQAEALAASAREGRRTMVIGPDGRGKTDLLLDVTRRLGPRALLVRVPSGLDQTEAVVVQTAAGLGDDALREADAALRERVDQIQPALDVLSRHLGNRLLIVDDVDYLATDPSVPDLFGVLGHRAAAVASWLGRHAALCSRADDLTPKGWATSRLERLTDPPLRLSNGSEYAVGTTWDRAGQDPARFRLALTLAQIEQCPPDRSAGREEVLLDNIWAALPTSHREALALLAVHGRPLPIEILGAIPSPVPGPVIADVRSLAAVGKDERAMWVEGPLQRFCRERLTPDEGVHAHLSLAAAFAGELRGDEPNAWSRASALIEAHRHYAAGRQPERALQLARYGVLVLLDLARERSRMGDFETAATIYEEVLKLPDAKVGPYAWAYAKHYLHYNRYKSKPNLVEPLSGTRDGYRSSVEKWPENALFWSRLALTEFLQGERGRALGTLEEARRTVPDHRTSRHSGKEWYLRCRTVQHLLRFEPPHVVDALHVWKSYTATHFREEQVERELVAALDRGFQTVVLQAPDVATVFLHQPITVRIIRAGKTMFACMLVDLHVSARAPDPLRAFTLAIARLREETDRFRRTLTHTLSPDARAHKQRLLGSVDLVASRLLGDVPETTWILGKVILGEQGAMRVREMGSGAGTFDLDPGVTPPRLPDSQPRLARVRAGAAGEPIGPVLELEKPLGGDAAQLLEEWRRRLGEVEPPHA